MFKVAIKSNLICRYGRVDYHHIHHNINYYSYASFHYMVSYVVSFNKYGPIIKNL